MAFVLKIKHNETLRRWVVSNTLPEKSSDFFLTVSELELKIRELFRFAVDEAVVVTYVDREGDVITLADDHDLVDACLVQGLNPLRLEVKVIGQKSSTENGANVGLCSRFSSVHASKKNISSANAKSPAPMRHDNGNINCPPKQAFPQVTVDAIKQFVEKYTKSLDPNLQPAVLIKNIQKVLKDFVKTLVHEGQRFAPRGGPAYAPCPTEASVCLSPVDDHNQSVHDGVRCDGCDWYPILGLRYKSTKVFNYDLCSKCFDKMGNVSDYQRIEKPVKMTCNSFSHPSFSSNEKDTEGVIDNHNLSVHDGVGCDGCDRYPIQGLRYKSTKVFNYDLCSTCFDKMGNASDYRRIEKPVKMSCHGFFHPPLSSNEKTSRVPMKWMTPFASGPEGWKSECPFLRTTSIHPPDGSKVLDASYVKEVTVFDTDELAPGVHFTRILRLKNTGSRPWPQGTVFAHVGGDMFALKLAISLKLPETGLAVGLEFDVCVEMRSPENCGNYMSHWCLMVPSGERFGQSLWIAIQVVGEINGPHPAEAAHKMSDIAMAVEEDCKVQKGVERVHSDIQDSGLATQTRELMGNARAAEGTPVKQATESPQFIVAFMGSADSVTDEEDGFSMIEKPVDAGSFKMAPAPLVISQVASPQPISVVQKQYASLSPLDVIRQQVNLHELELMGFTDHNLNVLLLEKNKQFLQLTLEDLLLGSGWPSLLQDLDDMGFEDANTNLRLLIKNQGSIRCVVRELVELEKLKVEV